MQTRPTELRGPDRRRERKGDGDGRTARRPACEGSAMAQTVGFLGPHQRGQRQAMSNDRSANVEGAAASSGWEVVIALGSDRLRRPLRQQWLAPRNAGPHDKADVGQRDRDQPEDGPRTRRQDRRPGWRFAPATRQMRRPRHSSCRESPISTAVVNLGYGRRHSTTGVSLWTPAGTSVAPIRTTATMGMLSGADLTVRGRSHVPDSRPRRTITRSM